MDKPPDRATAPASAFGSRSLGSHARLGTIVTAASQAFKMALGFVSVVVLARLLDPTDFGLMASAAPVIGLVGLFQNLGLSQALIQRERLDDEHINQAFWLLGAVSIVAALLIVATSPLIARFYDDERLVNVLFVLAASLVIGGLANVPASLLARELRFTVLAVTGTVAALVGFLTAASTAWYGWGYWSLAFAAVASAVSNLVLSWAFRPWRPSGRPRTIDRELLNFGANLTGFNLVNFLARNADNVLIGRVLGLEALGFYDRAYKLLLFPLQNLTYPLSGVMVPLLSRIQSDRERVRAVYVKMIWAIGMIGMPGVAALTMTSLETTRLLFGPQWDPVAPIFAWLGLVGFLQIVLATNGWLFISQGRTREMFRLGVFSSAVTVVAFAVGLPWGVVGVAIAYAVSAYLVRVPVLLVVLDRVGPVKAMDILTPLVVLGSAALAAYAVLQTIRSEYALAAHETVAASIVLNYALAAVAVLSTGTGRTNTLGVLRVGLSR